MKCASVALLAFGLGVAYISQCSKRNAGDAMTVNDHLLAFRGDYGRLCTLVAQALTRGHDQAGVVQAALGNGSDVAPVYVELRKQRKRLDETVSRCLAVRVPNADLVRAGTEANESVRQEWVIDLPKFTEKV